MSTSKSYLTEDDLKLFEEKGEIVKYRPKDVIVHQQVNCDKIYWIRDGVVQIDFDRLYNHDVLGYLNSGDMFGEISFMDHAVTSASASAVKDTETLEVSREIMEQLLDQDTALAARFYRTVAMTLARRIRSRNRQ